ncbi:hypothetical protein [Thiococcus pfennigii]|uniref:hypothetical protein n=1 Tax=Thiococcus pfennigii TaxID=1057 RepID=UPI001902EB13|nr:hypothetical protein [Thiococcus pfennigii]
MQTFEARALPDRIDDLIRAAESGGLSIVTRARRPISVAVPFDDALLGEGIRVALAKRLFDQDGGPSSDAFRPDRPGEILPISVGRDSR